MKIMKEMKINIRELTEERVAEIRHDIEMHPDNCNDVDTDEIIEFMLNYAYKKMREDNHVDEIFRYFEQSE